MSEDRGRTYPEIAENDDKKKSRNVLLNKIISPEILQNFWQIGIII